MYGAFLRLYDADRRAEGEFTNQWKEGAAIAGLEADQFLQWLRTELSSMWGTLRDA